MRTPTIIRCLLSYLKPVTFSEGDRFVLIIRGVLFEGSSRAEVLGQVRSEAERLRQQLADDSSAATSMISSANPRGRVSTGAVQMGGTLSRLEAYESFLETASSP